MNGAMGSTNENCRPGSCKAPAEMDCSSPVTALYLPAVTPKKFVAFIERAIGRPLSDTESAAFQAARDNTQGKRDTVKAMWDVARNLGLMPSLEDPVEGGADELEPGDPSARGTPETTRPDAR